MAKTTETVIGDDIYFKGRLRFEKGLEIQGKFQGQIQSNGYLSLGPTSRVEADIETASLTVRGHLIGNVVAHKNAELIKGSTTKGDIHTPDLSIQSGARFSGYSAMDTD